MSDKVKPRHSRRPKRHSDQFPSDGGKPFGSKIKREKRGQENAWKKNAEREGYV